MSRMCCCAQMAMYVGLDILRPYLPEESGEGKIKGVIGVVEGDTHDIGKNLVKIMMETAGFEMIDLGRDVPLEQFIETAKEEEADLICMSTLMTTTMGGMETVIQMLEDAGMRDKVKVMIGGGPISQKYADKIGADGYSQNAVEAVKLAKRLLNMHRKRRSKNADSKGKIVQCNERKCSRPADPASVPGGMMNMVTTDLMDAVDIYMPQAHTDARMMAGLAKAVYDYGCFENYGVPFCMTVEAEEMGAKVEMGSRVYEPHVSAYAIESVEDYAKLPPIDIGRGRAKVVLDAIRILREETDGVPIIGNLTGPISTASSVMEPVVFYKELRKKNKQAHAYMDFITRQLIAFGRAQIEAGADVIAISDPSGTGEILGPKYFEEFAVTYLNQLLDGLQEEKMGTIVQ